MRARIIVNTQAARFRRDPGLVAAMRHACSSRAEVRTTRTTGELAEVCRGIARDGSELVVLCGGDGTYMAGVSELDRVFGGSGLPAICLAPGGNASTVARNWGALLSDPVRHVCAVLDRAQSGSASLVERPTLRATQAEGMSHVGFIFGTGLVSSFFDVFYERGGGGYPQAARLVSQVFLGSLVGGSLARRVLSPMPCRLLIDGEPHPASAFTLIVSSVVKDLGLRLRVTHRGGEDPDRPHLVASTLGIRECGLQYRRVLTGRPLMGPRTVDRLTREFRVAFSGVRGTYVLDGELLSCSSVGVCAGPRVRIMSLP